jgi:ribosomal-protein-alanine N-acetyltransferase
MRAGVIRPLEPADAEVLTEVLRANREFLAPFVPTRGDAFFTVAAQQRRIADMLERRTADRGYAFAVLAGGRLAGTLELSNVSRGPFESATLGYWVAREFNGRGLATAAVGAVVTEAFGPLGLHRVEAGTLVDNRASQRVLEKNGFTPIGLAPRYLCIAGEWRDHALFQRLAD